MLCRCFSVQLLSPSRLRTVFLAFMSAAILLSLSSATEAAIWVRIWTDSKDPVAGVPELVRVQLVDTQGAQCLDDPDARVVPNPTAYSGDSGPLLSSMELHIHGPETANPLSLDVKRSVRDPSIWEGLFVFSEPGQWSLQMAYPSWSSGIAGVPGPPRWSTDTCTGAEQLITVLPRSNAAPGQCASPSIWCHPRTPI